MASYEHGLAKVTELENEVATGMHDALNEDTTRLRFVDQLFFDCLDWNPMEQVQTEEKTDVGIIDYAFRLTAASGPLLVVEAKKTGISFMLPYDSHRRNNALVRSIKALSSLDKPIAAAIDQVAAYATEQGAPFAVVTNGHQLIAFSVRTEPGKRWRDGHALVFDSPTQIRENFLTFWQSLSVCGIREFHLARLLGHVPDQPSPRRSESLPNFNRTKNRNDFQADLQIVGDLVFGGRIFEDRNLFHEHCYCPAGALPQYSRAARSYLEDRYPDFFASTSNAPILEPATTKKGPAEALKNLTNIRKPILLLGDVGVGKSTFLEHLFLVDWVDKKNELIVIRIDLADKPSRPDDLAETVRDQIDSALLDLYGIDTQEDGFLRGAYHSELARLRRTPEAIAAKEDQSAMQKLEAGYLTQLQARFDEHIKAIFRHIIKGRNKMVVLVFDNVDQRSAELQTATFIQAQIAASTWEVFVILALRPATFVRAKIEGAISGYHPRAFTISPPRFDQLLIRRIEAANKMLRGELPTPNLGPGITAHLTNVGDYLQVLQYSFATNTELVEFCDDISGGNMRLALDYIVHFMSSGHVDAPKILTRWRESQTYVIPLHEFVRGVMFSDREYYSSKAANIINVFEPSTGDPRETFAILSLLASIDSSQARGSDDDGPGFVSIEALTSALNRAGYSPSQVSQLIASALEKRLIETNLKSHQLDAGTHVRTTSTGAYYYAALVPTFVYVDAVCVDTPITDRDILHRIQDVQQLDARLLRAQAFVEYLRRIFDRYADLKTVLPWDMFEDRLLADVEKVRANNERAISRRK